MSTHRVQTWVGRGLVAGILLGLLEAAERSYAVREFLQGPGERLAFAALAFAFCAMTGAAVGLTAGGITAVLDRAWRTALPRPLLRLVLGALIGVVGAAWLLYALTLTVRFDAIVRRSQQVLLVASALGALAGLAWPPVTNTWHRVRNRRGARNGVRVLLAAGLVVLHLWNAHFAPQSSLGVHVVADTLLFAIAVLLAALPARAPRGRGLALALAGVIALLVWTDRTMRIDPALENLLKTRGSISAHTIRMWSAILDVDRDGFAPATLVGGEDPNNFDASIPQPVLPPKVELEGENALAAMEPETLPEEAAGPHAPHLVLLTLDACRVDVMPPYTASQSKLGRLLPPRPHLEALAPRVARFIVGYTPSAGTGDTFAALFSGWDLPGILDGVPEDQQLGARLGAAGYEVRGYANDPNFAVDSFDSRRLVRYAGDDGYRMLRDAAAFLDSLPPGQPGFAWIHVLDLHADLLKPFAWETFSHRAHLERYAHALVRVDSMVGNFVDALDGHGLTPSTLLVITADHGEELGGHGHYHHNLTLYQAAIRVPLWVMGPGIEPGIRAARVSLQAIYPTVIEAAGLTPGRSAGRSLWPVLRGTEPATSDSLIFSFLPQRGFSERYTLFPRVEIGQASLLDARRRHKVILRLGQGAWEAYDVSTDSLEIRNLAGSDATWPDSLRRLLERMIRERRTVPRRFPPAGPEAGGEARSSGSRLTGVVQTVAPERQSESVKDPSSQ